MDGVNRTSTASTTQQKALTLADLEQVARVLRDLPPEPIGEWMRTQGCPPEHWRVVFPKAFRESGPALWPDYVSFSGVLEHPVFLRR